MLNKPEEAEDSIIGDFDTLDSSKMMNDSKELLDESILKDAWCYQYPRAQTRLQNMCAVLGLRREQKLESQNVVNMSRKPHGYLEYKNKQSTYNLYTQSE